MKVTSATSGKRGGLGMTSHLGGPSMADDLKNRGTQDRTRVNK